MTHVPRWSERESTIHRYTVGTRIDKMIGFLGNSTKKAPQRNLQRSGVGFLNSSRDTISKTYHWNMITGIAQMRIKPK